MQINKIDNINFQAIPIANAKCKIEGINGKYKLYKITRNDMPFLHKVKNSIKLSEYAAGFNSDDYTNWSLLIGMGLASATYGSREGILCSYNNTPCGVLTYKPSEMNRVEVEYAATWPIEPNKKVPFANQVMFSKLFRDAIKNDKSGIELEALKNSPGSPISKYMQLGFSLYGGGCSTQEYMRISKKNIPEAINKLNTKIDLQELENEANVNLEEELNIVI